jgi:hypothetical protein
VVVESDAFRLASIAVPTEDQPLAVGKPRSRSPHREERRVSGACRTTRGSALLSPPSTRLLAQAAQDEALAITRYPASPPLALSPFLPLGRRVVIDFGLDPTFDRAAVPNVFDDRPAA